MAPEFDLMIRGTLVGPLRSAGFSRAGKTFWCNAGDLSAGIKLRELGQAVPGVERFRVTWGVMTPGCAAWAYRHRESVPRRPLLEYGMCGDQAVPLPPEQFYGGSMPYDRTGDPIWGFYVDHNPERSTFMACGECLASQLIEEVVPVLKELLLPGALLREVLKKRKRRRVNRFNEASWDLDAILLQLDDGPPKHIRDMLNRSGVKDTEFGAWVEAKLAERDIGA